MGTSHRSVWRSINLLPLLVLVVGCQGLQNGEQTWIQPTSQSPHAGNVYLVRGLIGVFSTGMDELSTKLNEQGIRARVFQDAQEHVLADWIIEAYKHAPTSEPLVLIGHSYGADDVVRVARKLNEQNIKVDLMVTIDATTPPEVPGNVAVCYNYFQSQITDGIPMFRGIPLKPVPGANVELHNYDLRKDRTDLLVDGTNHINIDKNPKLHDVVVQQVLSICPARDVWAARQAPQQARTAAGVVPPQQQQAQPSQRAASAATPHVAEESNPPADILPFPELGETDKSIDILPVFDPVEADIDPILDLAPSPQPNLANDATDVLPLSAWELLEQGNAELIQ